MTDDKLKKTNRLTAGENNFKSSIIFPKKLLEKGLLIIRVAIYLYYYLYLYLEPEYVMPSRATVTRCIDLGAHGSGLPSCSIEGPAHALPAIVVCQPALGSHEAQAPFGEHSPISAGGPALLGVPTASVDGNKAGFSDLLHSSVHRCIPDRVRGSPVLGER